jgi:glycosyltransferase 2 family protein
MFPFRSARSQRVGRLLRPTLPLMLLAVLVADLGADPFARSLHVLTPWPIAAALLLGVVATAAQAMRWHTVATACGAASGLTRGRALRECYRSTLLNTVLPGGVLGDAMRAWRQRPARERGLRCSAQAVVGERVAGTAVLLLAVAVVTVPLDLRVSGIMLAGATVATLIVAPTLGRLPVRGRFEVCGWSLLALTSLLGLFAVAAESLGTIPRLRDVVVLALIVLAGMAVPVGIGGFGPREAVAAIAFGSLGLGAQAGVATSAAYGVLAAVSAVPGAVIMLLDLHRAGRVDPRLGVRPERRRPDVVRQDAVRHDGRGRIRLGDGLAGGAQLTALDEIQLEADVLAEHEPTGRGA